MLPLQSLALYIAAQEVVYAYFGPTSTVDASTWTAVGAASHYQAIDEPPPASDSDYIEYDPPNESETPVTIRMRMDPRTHFDAGDVALIFRYNFESV